jgi:hypothetical protein
LQAASESNAFTNQVGLQGVGRQAAPHKRSALNAGLGEGGAGCRRCINEESAIGTEGHLGAVLCAVCFGSASAPGALDNHPLSMVESEFMYAHVAVLAALSAGAVGSSALHLRGQKAQLATPISHPSAPSHLLYAASGTTTTGDISHQRSPQLKFSTTTANHQPSCFAAALVLIHSAH